ncbi:hypothetical protein [Spiroplasma endosymbiont of Labia minor]|uniref:hypothetical protein n=1 Tax=Spiroplasma endosymbiont of Labia minor TaxID=3066305 RepID=UPI0030CAA99F
MNYWQFFGPIMIFGLLTQRNTLLSERKEVIIMKKEKLIKKINAEISLMDNSEYEIENDVLLAFYIIKFYNEKNIFTFLNNNLRIQKLVYFAYCMYYAINKKELMRRSKV